MAFFRAGLEVLLEWHVSMTIQSLERKGILVCLSKFVGLLLVQYRPIPSPVRKDLKSKSSNVFKDL
jgi:hypothetical protein